jgi:NTP pyrophosphatase (non-canonical NTP hydrolase)
VRTIGHIFKLILAERMRQDMKHGCDSARHQSAGDFYQTLVEEVGEAAKANRDETVQDEVKELTEVAACAVARIQKLTNEGEHS